MLKKPVLNLIWVIVKWKKKNKENNKEHGKENALLNERGEQFQLPKQEQAVANNLLGENNIPAIGGNNLKQDQNNPQPEVGTDNPQNSQLRTGNDLVIKALDEGATVEEVQALRDYLISDNGTLNAPVDAADITNGEIITQRDLDDDDKIATIPLEQVNDTNSNIDQQNTNSLISQVEDNIDQQNTNSLISQVEDNIDQQNQMINTVDTPAVDGSIDNVAAPSAGGDSQINNVAAPSVEDDDDFNINENDIEIKNNELQQDITESQIQQGASQLIEQTRSAEIQLENQTEQSQGHIKE